MKRRTMKKREARWRRTSRIMRKRHNGQHDIWNIVWRTSPADIRFTVTEVGGNDG